MYACVCVCVCVLIFSQNLADCMDFPDSLFPSFPFIHHSQQVLTTATSVNTEQM